jgi:Domain of unknown function DUF11
MKRILRFLSIAVVAMMLPSFLFAQNDLSVGIRVNLDTANIGASRTFTVTVYNKGKTAVTGVRLSTVFTAGFTSVVGSTATGTFAANDWNIGAISAATDSVSLTLTTTVSGEGVQTLTAQISAMVEPDGDSAPNNNDLREDDIHITCVSVPIYYCDGSTVDLTATASFSGAGVTYQWYKNGGLLAGETNQTYRITSIGSYSYTATGGSIGTCSGSMCCPIIVRYVPTPTLVTTAVSICSGSSTDLAARVTDSNTATFALGTTSFYPTMADATAQTNALASTTVSPTTTTTYYVRKNVTTNGYTCNDIKTIVVTVNPLPTLVTTPVSICNGSSTDLAARVNDTNAATMGTGSIVFYPTMADATAETNALASTTVSPTTTTTYFVRKNTTSTPVCNTIASFIVTVHAVPTLVTTPLTICNGSSTDLASRVTDSNGSTSATGTITFYPTMADATAETNALASSTVSPTATTTYYVRKNTPTSPVCNDIESIVITVNATVTAGTGTNPANTCQAGSGILSMDLAAQIAGETTGGTWSQPSGTSVGSALNTTTGALNLNGLAVGTYVFRYTVTATAPCPTDTEDITVIIEACCPTNICLPVMVVRNN